MSEPFLTTERLCLRSLQEADFPDYAAYATDDEMSRMMGRALLKTEADIRRECQRKGYASEAVRAVIQELFLVERLDYVQCGCYTFNKPSLHLQK